MKRSYLIHPILFAVFPILYLASENLGQVIWHEVIRTPILISLAATLLLYLACWATIRNAINAGILTSLFLVMFYSYGHFHSLLNQIVTSSDSGVTEKLNHTLTFPACATLFFILAWFVGKSKRDLNAAARSFTVAGLVLVFFSASGILKREMKNAGLKERLITEAGCSKTVPQSGSNTEGANYPDIYYLILDSYTNNTNLKADYHFDNFEFTSYLEAQGFYIADQSRSNYATTSLSISSSLNMDYVNDLVRPLGVDSADHTFLFNQIRNNQIQKFLNSKGYSIIQLVTPLSILTNNPCVDRNIRSVYTNEFLLHLIKMSALSPFVTVLNIVRDDFRRGILNGFEELKKAPSMPGPKFVFAHFITPHPPFFV